MSAEHDRATVIRLVQALSDRDVEAFEQQLHPEVAVRQRVSGTHAGPMYGFEATGNDFEMAELVIDHLRDGQIVGAWPLADCLSMLRQVGAIAGR